MTIHGGTEKTSTPSSNVHDEKDDASTVQTIFTRLLTGKLNTVVLRISSVLNDNVLNTSFAAFPFLCVFISNSERVSDVLTTILKAHGTISIFPMDY